MSRESLLCDDCSVLINRQDALADIPKMESVYVGYMNKNAAGLLCRDSIT